MYKIQGYDAGEDNAEVGQLMYIPKLLTRSEPEIRPKDPKGLILILNVGPHIYHTWKTIAYL